MDKAKEKIGAFMHKAGHNDTTVHEKVAPAVTHETVQKQRHEEVGTAVDREVHQDHYHTSVQPVMDREVRPEHHESRVAPVQHREFRDNDQDAAVRSRIEAEASRFQNTREEGPTTVTRADAPAEIGEHRHHHLHETIQPVIQRETIEQEVVHTTVPVHEVHHEGAKVHSTSQLPAVSMGDFKSHGGTLGGREERYDGFEGEPKYATGNAGISTGSGAGGLGHSSSDRDGHGTTSTKPSLMDKLNPKKDSDGDGKAGFMK